MMFTTVAALVAAIGVSALPNGVPKYTRQMAAATAPTDTQVLQYALTLENLEKTFYAEALSKFDAKAFSDAGYPAWVRGRFMEIAGHESEHVALLSSALGNQSVAACSYKFPYTDVKSFISLASLIENVGVSAYAGAAQYIKTPAYVTVAVTIHSTEARHQAWQNADVQQLQPWSSAYDTPLTLDQVYTIASQFITSCPSTNAALPVKASKQLTVVNGIAGQTASYTFDNTGNGSGVQYAIYYSGLGSAAVALSVDHKAMVPKGLQGISYVVISSSSTAAGVTTANTVAGPAILVNNFDAYTANPAFMG